MNRTSFLLLSLLLFIGRGTHAQIGTVIPPSNRSAVSLEKNMLFYANNRFSVTQSGSVNLNLGVLFDGNQFPTYSSQGIDPEDPYVLLIEGLPNVHVQQGAWVGWATRGYQAKRFRIEVYNTYQGANQWVTVADESNYTGTTFISQVSGAVIGKIRVTVYETVQAQNRLGISELFYLHPEAAKAYDALAVQYNSSGNVGIGTTNPTERLSVNGNIRAREIKVETANWPDYVFQKDYDLKPLSEVARFIRENGHLPDIPRAPEVEEEGVSLGKMNRLLLQKVEELTLHLIEKEKDIERQKVESKKLEDRVKQLEQATEQ